MASTTKNWLIHITKQSSRPFQIPEQLNDSIDVLTNKVVDYYINNEQNKESYIWHITNPYLNTQYDVEVSIYPHTLPTVEFSRYDSKRKVLEFFPYTISIKPEYKNKAQILELFKGAVRHELVHILDPKSYLQIQDPISIEEYYSSATEFDAYSKEIIENIKNEILIYPPDESIVLSWIRSSDLTCYGPLTPYANVIKYWRQSDINNRTNLIRKFKQRLYHSISGDNKDVNKNK